MASYGNAIVDQNLLEEYTCEQHRRQLAPEAIREYKEIYKAEFGFELTDAEAEEQGLRLLRLFSLLLRPFPDDPKE